MFDHDKNFIFRGLPLRPDCVRWSPLNLIALGADFGILIVDPLKQQRTHACLNFPAETQQTQEESRTHTANMSHFMAPMLYDSLLLPTWADFAWAPLAVCRRTSDKGQSNLMLAVVLANFAVLVYEIQCGYWQDKPVLLCHLQKEVPLEQPATGFAVVLSTQSLSLCKTNSHLRRNAGKSSFFAMMASKQVQATTRTADNHRKSPPTHPWTPSPPDQSDHSRNKRNVQSGNPDQAIFGTQTLGPRPPPPPPPLSSDVSLSRCLQYAVCCALT